LQDAPPDALNLLDVTELSTPSSWKHTITPQPTSHTPSPSKGSTLTASGSHNTKQALESKVSVSSHKYSVLSVSAEQSITGSAATKYSASRSEPIPQLSNGSPSLDKWNLHKDIKNSQINSVMSTKDSPNSGILPAKDIIKNIEITDTSDAPAKPKTTAKPRQNLPASSPITISRKSQNEPKQKFPVTPPNMKSNISTKINHSTATKSVTSPATVISVPTKNNISNTQKYRDMTTEVTLMADQTPKTVTHPENNLLQRFHDVIFLSTTKSPPVKMTTIPTLAVTKNMSMQFVAWLTATPMGALSSSSTTTTTTSRVVRVREVKSALEPATTTTDSYIQRTPSRTTPQSNVQASTTTEVPSIFMTSDMPLTTTELVPDVMTLDLPTTTFETLNLQDTTLPTLDLHTTTELITVPETTTIPTTTNIPATTNEPTITTIPTTTTISATRSLPITTIIPTTTPATTTVAPSAAQPQLTTLSIITLQAADSNVQPLSVTQTTTTAAPRVFTTTLPTPVPYVIFGIYPNGTVFRKLPNSDFKEQVHENEIARRNPFYPDQRYFSTAPPAPALSVGSNEAAPQAPSFDDGSNAARNEIQDEDVQVRLQ